MSTEVNHSAFEEITIDHLNAQGEGVAHSAGGLTSIAFSLPGEKLRIDRAGRIDAILEASPDRAEAFCPEFGRCGGCTFQHMNLSTYAAFKQDMVQKAVLREGLAVKVSPTLVAHGAGRRRAIVHARFGPGGARVGFMAARSHDLISIGDCPVLVPELKDVFEVARIACGPLAGRNKPLDIQISSTINGLDVDIRGHGEPDAGERKRLIGVAQQLDLARLSIHREIIVERRPPIITINDLQVILPPRAFMQATAEAETVLADLVLTGVGKARSVADLFCGIGPFALRLAARMRVHGVDEGKDAVAALDRAWRSRQGLKAVSTEARDLFQRPLLPMELAAFDAVIVDPPRAGAEAQMRQLASSRVKTVVSVSCDLQSFLRDARILLGGGFTLVSLTPVDQFAWTKHIELVGVFRR
jgi:23S rRNA (uracil1939-C5)-methyltransferase